MLDKKVSEKKLAKVTGGADDEEEVWTWFKCFRPNCQYEFTVRGRFPEGTQRMCWGCYNDSAISTGKYEE